MDIYDPRSFSHCGPAGCNHCGGIVSKSLVQILAAEGINLPSSVVQRGIESYVVHLDVGSVAIQNQVGEQRIAALYRGNGPREGGESPWGSFDGYLQDLAVQRGASVVRKLVTDIDWRSGFPWLQFADQAESKYDLVTVATGVNSNFLKIVDENILAGGDTLNIGIAGNATVQGRNAAEQIHARLRGIEEPNLLNEARPSISPKKINLTQKPLRPAPQAPKLAKDERMVKNDAEVTGTISESQFLQEVERCFSCGSCIGCEQCSMYCTLSCYTKLDEVGPGMYFTLVLDACKQCGKCVEVCPSGFLETS